MKSDVNRTGVTGDYLLPDRDRVEVLCTSLSSELAEAQGKHGHFQWKIEVHPERMRQLKATILATPCL